MSDPRGQAAPQCLVCPGGLGAKMAAARGRLVRVSGLPGPGCLAGSARSGWVRRVAMDAVGRSPTMRIGVRWLSGGAWFWVGWMVSGCGWALVLPVGIRCHYAPDGPTLASGIVTAGRAHWLAAAGPAYGAIDFSLAGRLEGQKQLRTPAPKAVPNVFGGAGPQGARSHVEKTCGRLSQVL
jgi:hypothetical protein